MKPKYLLIFSQESANIYGFNTIKTVDDKIVSYTNLTENHENWRENYKWKDSVEVGFAESINDIVSFGIRVTEWYNKLP